MISFDEARLCVLQGAVPLGSETVSLHDLGGRVLSGPIDAPFDLPAFDRSSVDGYGIRAADAGDSLDVIGELAAGQDPSQISVSPGQAVRLFTGSGIPPGVDAVVMQEDVVRAGNRIHSVSAAKVGDFIRRRGAELRRGDAVLEAGTRFTPPVLSLLASLGMSHADVYRRPRVRIVMTGDELACPGSDLKPGQVYEAISPGIRAAVLGAGGYVVATETVRDDLDSTRGALEGAMDADVVITCGGVSVGDHDLVRPALVALGVEQRVWSVAMRPGKPFFYGVGPEGQRVFGLPGNPVSALVTFYTLVRPVLLALGGRLADAHVRLPLHAPNGLPRVGDRDDFLRASIHGGGVSVKLAQESHMLTGLASANALLRLPAHSGPYADGAEIEALPIEWE